MSDKNEMLRIGDTEALVLMLSDLPVGAVVALGTPGQERFVLVAVVGHETSIVDASQSVTVLQEELLDFAATCDAEPQKTEDLS